MTISLASLSSHVEIDQWYPLSGGTGKLKVRFDLEEELILPLQSYKSLMELSIAKGFEIPVALLQSTANQDRTQFSQTVLKVMESKGKAFDFLVHLVKIDVDSASESAVLFRVNTFTTKGILIFFLLFPSKNPPNFIS